MTCVAAGKEGPLAVAFSFGLDFDASLPAVAAFFALDFLVAAAFFAPVDLFAAADFLVAAAFFAAADLADLVDFFAGDICLLPSLLAS